MSNNQVLSAHSLCMQTKLTTI